MNKVPIVILHGWNLSASRFLPLTTELKRRGYKVYCPDLAGFGKTKIPENSWFLSDYVDFVKKFLEKNKLEKIILIGHSFGGRIGIKFAIKNPAFLSALILSGAPGVIPVRRSKAVFFIFLAKIGKKVFSLPIINVVKNKARQILYRVAGAMDYYNTDEKMRETFKNIVKENLEPYLREINSPTLLLWGSGDKIIPLTIAQRMQNILKKSKLEIIDNARHGVPWTHPKEFADEVEKFLKEL